MPPPSFRDWLFSENQRTFTGPRTAAEASLVALDQMSRFPQPGDAPAKKWYQKPSLDWLVERTINAPEWLTSRARKLGDVMQDELAPRPGRNFMLTGRPDAPISPYAKQYLAAVPEAFAQQASLANIALSAYAPLRTLLPASFAKPVATAGAALGGMSIARVQEAAGDVAEGGARYDQKKRVAELTGQPQPADPETEMGLAAIEALFGGLGVYGGISESRRVPPPPPTFRGQPISLPLGGHRSIVTESTPMPAGQYGPGRPRVRPGVSDPTGAYWEMEEPVAPGEQLQRQSYRGGFPWQTVEQPPAGLLREGRPAGILPEDAHPTGPPFGPSRPGGPPPEPSGPFAMPGNVRSGWSPRFSGDEPMAPAPTNMPPSIRGLLAEEAGLGATGGTAPEGPGIPGRPGPTIQMPGEIGTGWAPWMRGDEPVGPLPANRPVEPGRPSLPDAELRQAALERFMRGEVDPGLELADEAAKRRWFDENWLQLPPEPPPPEPSAPFAAPPPFVPKRAANWLGRNVLQVQYLDPDNVGLVLSGLDDVAKLPYQVAAQLIPDLPPPPARPTPPPVADRFDIYPSEEREAMRARVADAEARLRPAQGQQGVPFEGPVVGEQPGRALSPLEELEQRLSARTATIPRGLAPPVAQPTEARLPLPAEPAPPPPKFLPPFGPLTAPPVEPPGKPLGTVAPRAAEAPGGPFRKPSDLAGALDMPPPPAPPAKPASLEALITATANPVADRRFAVVLDAARKEGFVGDESQFRELWEQLEAENLDWRESAADVLQGTSDDPEKLLRLIAKHGGLGGPGAKGGELDILWEHSPDQKPRKVGEKPRFDKKTGLRIKGKPWTRAPKGRIGGVGGVLSNLRDAKSWDGMREAISQEPGFEHFKDIGGEQEFMAAVFEAASGKRSIGRQPKIGDPNQFEAGWWRKYMDENGAPVAEGADDFPFSESETPAAPPAPTRPGLDELDAFLGSPAGKEAVNQVGDKNRAFKDDILARQEALAKLLGVDPHGVTKIKPPMPPVWELQPTKLTTEELHTVAQNIEAAREQRALAPMEEKVLAEVVAEIARREGGTPARDIATRLRDANESAELVPAKLTTDELHSVAQRIVAVREERGLSPREDEVLREVVAEIARRKMGLTDEPVRPSEPTVIAPAPSDIEVRPAAPEPPAAEPPAAPEPPTAPAPSTSAPQDAAWRKHRSELERNLAEGDIGALSQAEIKELSDRLQVGFGEIKRMAVAGELDPGRPEVQAALDAMASARRALPPMKRAVHGEFLAPVGKDYVFVKLPSREYATAHPEVKAALVRAGYTYRHGKQAWFKDAGDMTPEQLEAEAAELLGGGVAAEAPPKAVPPPPANEPVINVEGTAGETKNRQGEIERRLFTEEEVAPLNKKNVYNIADREALYARLSKAAMQSEDPEMRRQAMESLTALRRDLLDNITGVSDDTLASLSRSGIFDESTQAGRNDLAIVIEEGFRRRGQKPPTQSGMFGDEPPPPPKDLGELLTGAATEPNDVWAALGEQASRHDSGLREKFRALVKEMHPDDLVGPGTNGQFAVRGTGLSLPQIEGEILKVARGESSRYEDVIRELAKREGRLGAAAKPVAPETPVVEVPPAAEGATTMEQLPPNVRSFLTRQLGYSADDINAMSPDEAIALGQGRTKKPAPPPVETPTEPGAVQPPPVAAGRPPGGGGGRRLPQTVEELLAGYLEGPAQLKVEQAQRRMGAARAKAGAAKVPVAQTYRGGFPKESEMEVPRRVAPPYRGKTLAELDQAIAEGRQVDAAQYDAALEADAKSRLEANAARAKLRPEESLAEQEREARGLAPVQRGEVEGASKHKDALHKGGLTRANAKRAYAMKDMLEKGTRESIDEYARALTEQITRENDQAMKWGVSEQQEAQKKWGDEFTRLKPDKETGEYLGSAWGAVYKFFKDNPALAWRQTGGIVTAVVGAEEDPDNWEKWLAAGTGIALGPQALRKIAPVIRKALPEVTGNLKRLKKQWQDGPQAYEKQVRRARDYTKDLTRAQMSRGIGAVEPELLYDIMEMNKAAERAVHAAAPSMRQQLAAMYHQQTVDQIKVAAKLALQDGHTLEHQYLMEFARKVGGVPVYAAKLAEALARAGGTKVTAHHIEAAFRQVNRQIYRVALGANPGSALVNRTQSILAIPRIGVKAWVQGVREARGAAGKQRARDAGLIYDDVLADARRKTPAGPVGAVVDAVDKAAFSMFSWADEASRTDVYHGAKVYARYRNWSAADAERFAFDLVTQTQGLPGELAGNPFLHQFMPLRALSHYPTLYAELLVDLATHPDKRVALRAVGLLSGAAALTAMTGVSFINMLVPRFSVLGPAADIAGSLWSESAHIPGGEEPTHSLRDDLKAVFTPKGPKKFLDVIKARVPESLGGYGEGLQPRQVYNRKGLPTLNTEVDPRKLDERGLGSKVAGALGFTAPGNTDERRTATEDLLNLLGGETTRQTGLRARNTKEWLFKQQVSAGATQIRDEGRRNLRDAIERDDREDILKYEKQLSPGQLREFYRQSRQSPTERTRRTMTHEQKRAFDKAFGGYKRRETAPGSPR